MLHVVESKHFCFECWTLMGSFVSLPSLGTEERNEMNLIRQVGKYFSTYLLDIVEGTPQNKRKTPKVRYGFVALDPWLVLVGFSPWCKCKCMWYLTTGHMLLHCCCWRINVWLWKLCDIIPVFLACFFSLLFLFLTNDMTPPPPPPPCVPTMTPGPSPSKPLSFTLFFQKNICHFHYKWNYHHVFIIVTTTQVSTIALFDNHWCMKSTSLNSPENDENLPTWIK